MTRKRPGNLAASVKQRLLNLARRTGRPYSDLSRHYAMERFLYRLSRLRQSREFVLKGALRIRRLHLEIPKFVCARRMIL